MRPRYWAVPFLALMQAGCGADEPPSGADANALQSPAAQVALAQQQGGPATARPDAQQPLATSAAEDDATLFRAAGFQREGDHWAKCGDPGSAAYSPGEIAERGDFNADGRPDAILMEGSSACFGMAGTGYTLISQQADGGWKIMSEQIGIPNLLETKGADGWPDIEIGGPGFCFPVHRWNGREYELNRLEYEGRPCTREP